MAALPPKNDPIWTQLEDDVADGHWRVAPRPFLWWGFKQDDPYNRRLLAKTLIRWRLGLRGMVIVCSVAAVFLLGVERWIGVPPPAKFSFQWLATRWFPHMVAVGLVFQFVPYATWVPKFDRYFRHYLEQRGPKQLPPEGAQSA